MVKTFEVRAARVDEFIGCSRGEGHWRGAGSASVSTALAEANLYATSSGFATVLRHQRPAFRFARCSLAVPGARAVRGQPARAQRHRRSARLTDLVRRA